MRADAVCPAASSARASSVWEPFASVSVCHLYLSGDVPEDLTSLPSIHSPTTDNAWSSLAGANHRYAPAHIDNIPVPRCDTPDEVEYFVHARQFFSGNVEAFWALQ